VGGCGFFDRDDEQWRMDMTHKGIRLIVTSVTLVAGEGA
jgi:hypothetical protein